MVAKTRAAHPRWIFFLSTARLRHRHRVQIIQLCAVDKSSRTETARHAGERKVGQVSEYEWDSDSEGESIKDVDNQPFQENCNNCNKIAAHVCDELLAVLFVHKHDLNCIITIYGSLV